MHDIQRQLPVVDAGTIHAEFRAARSSHLRGEHRGFSEDNYSTLAQAEDKSLRPTRC